MKLTRKESQSLTFLIQRANDRSGLSYGYDWSGYDEQIKIAKQTLTKLKKAYENQKRIRQ